MNRSLHRNGLAASLGVLLLLAAFVVSVEAATPDDPYVGSVTFVGESSTIDDDVIGDVVVIQGSLLLNGRVEGDLVAWGGDVELGPDSTVTGSLLLVGGSLNPDPSSQVGGRVLLWTDVADLARSVLIDGAAVPADLVDRWRWGLRLFGLLVWLVVGIGVILLLGERADEAAFEVRAAPFRMFAAGIAIFFAAFFGAWAMIAARLSPVSAVGPIAVGLFALLIKTVGMPIVLMAFGRWLAGTAGRRVESPAALAIGVVVLGLIRYLPVVGHPIWVLASMIGFGAGSRVLFNRFLDRSRVVVAEQVNG